MILDYLNRDAQALFDSFSTDADRTWVWEVIKAVRQHYPSMDHWTTGGIDYHYMDLRFGCRKLGKARASAVFFQILRKPDGPVCHLDPRVWQAHPELKLIRPHTHPARKDIDNWLQKIAAHIPGSMERHLKQANRQVPRDYSPVDVQPAVAIEPPPADPWAPSPLNRILQGPPGTGKTHATIDEALAILDPEFLQQHAKDRARLKTRFDELAQAGRVRFITFHQSLSYEDFIEGLRAERDEASGALNYRVVNGVFKDLCQQAARDQEKSADAAQPYVLVIDEINRGNVSRIFGELLTLIEPGKRAGAPEALEVTLPHSRQRFSVPANVHLIGTMNTADRSLAGLDIALRRRFTFKEMPPRPELLDGAEVDGVNLGALLRVMNERIEVLLDRDHLIGHAYFLPLVESSAGTLTALAQVFRQQIVPLLQEYFFEDWERIGWVLNDPAKALPHRFVQPGGRPLADLFGAAVAEQLSDRRWRINEAAFGQIESYRGILTAS